MTTILARIEADAVVVWDYTKNFFEQTLEEEISALAPIVESAVAAVVAEAAGGVVTGTARAAGIRSAGFAGTMARWAIWIFAIIVALSQLGIATAYFQTLFTGVIVALSLAFGLAFGLGGQEAAARFIEKTKEGMHSK